MLDALRVAVLATIPRELAEDMKFAGNHAKVDVSAEYLSDMLCVRLRSYVLAEKLADVTKTSALSVPASWWQHLKADHFPCWYTRRWPVRTTSWTQEVNFKAYRTYPNASIMLPASKWGGPHIVEIVERGAWETM
jgi:hypothetical protein